MMCRFELIASAKKYIDTLNACNALLEIVGDIDLNKLLQVVAYI